MGQDIIAFLYLPIPFSKYIAIANINIVGESTLNWLYIIYRGLPSTSPWFCVFLLQCVCICLDYKVRDDSLTTKWDWWCQLSHDSWMMMIRATLPIAFLIVYQQSAIWDLIGYLHYLSCLCGNSVVFGESFTHSRNFSIWLSIFSISHF